jgi:ElaB/YqjD/DUF883 family membrane-anchored ribosome-binding protein
MTMSANPDQAGEAVPDTAELQAEIVQARRRLAAGVDELSDRLDVKKQAKAKAEDIKEQAQAKAVQAKEQLTQQAGRTSRVVADKFNEARTAIGETPLPDLARRRDVQIAAATGVLLAGLGVARRVRGG